jgi:hypothetical protein
MYKILYHKNSVSLVLDKKYKRLELAMDLDGRYVVDTVMILFCPMCGEKLDS